RFPPTPRSYTPCPPLTLRFFPFFTYHRSHRHLHSFPTRRSSDLCGSAPASVGPEPFEAVGTGARPAGARRLAGRAPVPTASKGRSEEHTSELQSRGHLVCRLLLEKKKKKAED